jgi:septum formation protein
MKLPSFILASGSPRRHELLEQLGARFQVKTATVEELEDPNFTPRELCRANAFRKAQVAAMRHPEKLVIGADTLVHVDNETFGKPASLAEARRMLRRLSGRSHEVTTACCLVQWRPPRRVVFDETTLVRFAALSDRQIRNYLAAIDPLDKAGAYAIQEHGEWIVEALEGSFTNVVGLPVERLREELASWREGEMV